MTECNDWKIGKSSYELRNNENDLNSVPEFSFSALKEYRL